LVDDLLDEGQPQADPVTTSRVEHVEQTLPLSDADAWALVCDLEERSACVVDAGSHLDRSLVG